MNADGSVAPSACYPSLDDVLLLEMLRESLAFAIGRGNWSRASDLADSILDHVRR